MSRQNYKIVDTIRQEGKLNKYLFLFDLMLVGSTAGIAWFTKGFVYEPFQWYYFGYTLFLAFFMTRKPKSNPMKRNYQVTLLALKMDNRTYHMIDANELRERTKRDEI